MRLGIDCTGNFMENLKLPKIYHSKEISLRL